MSLKIIVTLLALSIGLVALQAYAAALFHGQSYIAGLLTDPDM